MRGPEMSSCQERGNEELINAAGKALGVTKRGPIEKSQSRSVNLARSKGFRNDVDPPVRRFHAVAGPPHFLPKISELIALSSDLSSSIVACCASMICCCSWIALTMGAMKSL